MMQYEVAKKYSQALFALGREQGELVSLQKQLDEFWSTVNEYEELKDIFFHPRVKPEDKQRILKKVFGDELPATLYNFLFLLIDKRREYFFTAIREKYRQLVNEELNVVEIEVTSAVPLTGAQKKKLKNKLSSILDYDEIIMQLQTAPEIIGGLKIKVGDQVVNGSISNQLETITEKLRNIPVSKLGV